MNPEPNMKVPIPTAYTPAEMDSIKNKHSKTVRVTLEKLEDMSERNSTFGVFRAGDSDPEKVEIDKVSKTNDDGIVGDQPNDPISPLESERFFLSELIKALGLDPVKALQSGATPDGAGEALAMACAQIKAESNFVPQSENMNYSAAGLRATFKMFSKP